MEPSAASIVREVCGTRPVDLGLVLGSGLGNLADTVDGRAIAYAELPGFPQGNVTGHAAKLVVGDLEDCRVAIFSGRSHYYERAEASEMRPHLTLLRDLGASKLILTNAAGSLDAARGAGELMLLSDHINLSGVNPLFGEASDGRFVDMSQAYDPQMRAQLLRAAEEEELPLGEGVYAWYSGPSFETPAEIRALRVLGADAVGMSTVHETVLARFLGLEVAALSMITNLASGMTGKPLSHGQTKAEAKLGSGNLERLLRRYLALLSSETQA